MNCCNEVSFFWLHSTYSFALYIIKTIIYSI